MLSLEALHQLSEEKSLLSFNPTVVCMNHYKYRKTIREKIYIALEEGEIEGILIIFCLRFYPLF